MFYYKTKTSVGNYPIKASFPIIHEYQIRLAIRSGYNVWNDNITIEDFHIITGFDYYIMRIKMLLNLEV